MSTTPVLPRDELAEVFGAEALDGSRVVAERLYEPVASASLGIWRVRAADRSAVLKLVAHSEGGHTNWRSALDPKHWYYWRREVLAYESGLLDSLPRSLRAPRCYTATARGDGSVALWIEDLGDASATTWGIERYALAARHLGQTQGSYLERIALPDDEWLSRGWLRSYLSQRDGDLAFLDDAATWRDPRIMECFPVPPIERAKAMRRDRSLFLDALDRMPRTLCHLDLHPANLFADGDDATVAIDWSFMGLGAIGEDAGNLVPDAVLDFHCPPDRVGDLYAAVADGYEAGLREAGWNGGREVVRLAMSATMAAKYAWILPALLRGVGEGRELVNARPVAETARWWAPTIEFLFERADEARALATHA